MIPVGEILSFGSTIISKIFPDPLERAKAQAALLELEQQGKLKELESAMNVIVSEAKSEHWIVAAWRPITMLIFAGIVANNYIIYPYLSLFWSEAPKLILPPDLWDLLKIGLGGYIVGRSSEKVVKTIKDR
jgi:Protein of unknown function (DUF3154).